MKKKRKVKEGATNGISLVMFFARISNPFKWWQWRYVDLDNNGGCMRWWNTKNANYSRIQFKVTMNALGSTIV